jgi:hypothetical protein
MVSGGIVHLFFRVHIELNKSKDNNLAKVNPNRTLVYVTLRHLHRTPQILYHLFSLLIL